MWHNHEKWGEETKMITKAIAEGQQAIFTKHFWDSLNDRGIEVGDVYSIFKNETAEIIQGHAPGTYAIPGGKLNKDPIRVFYGRTKKGKVIHVVVALSGSQYKFVTVYYPNRKFFLKDLKTLKKKFRHKEI